MEGEGHCDLAFSSWSMWKRSEVKDSLTVPGERHSYYQWWRTEMEGSLYKPHGETTLLSSCSLVHDDLFKSKPPSHTTFLQFTSFSISDAHKHPALPVSSAHHLPTGSPWTKTILYIFTDLLCRVFILFICFVSI